MASAVLPLFMNDRIFKNLLLNKIRFWKIFKIHQVLLHKIREILFYNDTKRLCSQLKYKMGAKGSKSLAPYTTLLEENTTWLTSRLKLREKDFWKYFIENYSLYRGQLLIPFLLLSFTWIYFEDFRKRSSWNTGSLYIEIINFSLSMHGNELM